MLKFIKGEGTARGVRYMQMRMWYARDEVANGNTQILHMLGIIIPTDKLTKLGNVYEHTRFTRQVQGLDLIGLDFNG
jgi:hypothetical protein